MIIWKMRILLSILASFMLFNGECQNGTSNSSGLSYDTTKIAILPFDVRSYYGESAEGNIPSTFTQDDIIEIGNILPRCIAEYDSVLPGRNREFFSVNLNQREYRRQYMCSINKKGEKIVYLNCFCNSDLDWHKFIIRAMDGGNCYFHLKINLSTRDCFDFVANGSP